MGIRIRKVLGYGFVDIKTTDGQIVDPRFKQEWVDNMWSNKEKTTDGFFEFSKQQKNKNNHYDSLHLIPGISFIGGGKPYMDDMLTYDSEYGLPEVLVLTPITGKEWKRLDDTLDYYEERTKGYWDLTPHVEVLDTPLYPYDNYIDNTSGSFADSHVREWIYQYRNAQIELESKQNLDDKTANKWNNILENALERLGCKMHWTEQWNVGIPDEIQDYCRYMEMFTDESHMWRLQPLIYTYWS